MEKAKQIIDLCLDKRVSLNQVLDHFKLHRMILISELNGWLEQGENFEEMRKYIDELATL